MNATITLTVPAGTSLLVVFAALRDQGLAITSPARRTYVAKRRALPPAFLAATKTDPEAA